MPPSAAEKLGTRMTAAPIKIANWRKLLRRTGPDVNRCKTYAERTAFRESFAKAVSTNHRGAGECASSARRTGSDTAKYSHHRSLGTSRRAHKRTESANQSGAGELKLKTAEYI